MSDDNLRLFDAPAPWVEHWQDMPEFVQGDDRPSSTMQVYFRTEDDRRDFLTLVGADPRRSTGIWYPLKPRQMDGFQAPYEPEKVKPNRYPIYVISKGRWELTKTEGASSHIGGLTYRALDNLGIDYRLVIEPQEYDAYAERVDPSKILTLPFSELGQGSIPARNWVWDHAVESGAERHWILDDNLGQFARVNRNTKRVIKDENPFVPCEDFVDRYENVALAGLNYRSFVDPKHPDLPPYKLNTRIYSCILINNAIPFRWRGRYNEDTDLSLRVLKAGWVTVLLNAYVCDKGATLTLAGGNTDELYAGDGRLKMAQSLRDQHPDVVTITTKWARPQHHVDYSPFRHNELVRRRERMEEAA